MRLAFWRDDRLLSRQKHVDKHNDWWWVGGLLQLIDWVCAFGFTLWAANSQSKNILGTPPFSPPFLVAISVVASCIVWIGLVGVAFACWRSWRRRTAVTTPPSTIGSEEQTPSTTSSTHDQIAAHALPPERSASFQLAMQEPISSRVEAAATAAAAATKAANARAHRERYEDARAMARATSPVKVFGSWLWM